jgi:hypothetical protein
MLSSVATVKGSLVMTSMTFIQLHLPTGFAIAMFLSSGSLSSSDGAAFMPRRSEISVMYSVGSSR